ncbi:MAG: bifunctional phosphoribosylaminoimidazolecarboxamide formyltransferase/IMP cyclohydrolase [Chloroflexota bacterium]|nr:bifunctional phosphoribosylaminoimidazolecarboxamide formyltransferase/IMP cyclohydrolase [Chloroflexota bacterium]
MRRAIFSVADKTGVVELAQAVVEAGFEILSTGGTARALRESDVPVVEVSDVTGFPEILGGRVKTLHPAVHGGILARRTPEQLAELEKLEITPLDLVVCNLYPFEATVARSDVTLEEAVEQIDIGGVALLRAAAKNFESVAVVCDPADYKALIEELKTDDQIGLETRRKLALKAFRHTAHYDAVIQRWLGRAFGEDEVLPETIHLELTKIQGLRYGENPHQRGAFYRLKQAVEPGLAGAEQLHGRELSYNNIRDLAAALEMAREFEDPTVAMIKHNSPCGIASAPDILQALEGAWSCDPMSAYGSVIGVNRTVTEEFARRLTSREYLRTRVVPRYRSESGDEEVVVLAAFIEAIIAPDYEPQALETLKTKRNLRIMRLRDFAPESRFRSRIVHAVPGGALVQQADRAAVPPAEYQVVTKARPTSEQLRSLAFADRVAKYTKSNAIVLVKGTAAVGVGAGQMSRFDSTLIAARKAGKRAQGAVLASDAMFPAADGVIAAIETGAAAIIQPGGSIRDEEVIAATDEAGVPMVFTGMRHFRH